jgi:medium-chain acyl-[acyl-carrier-protein] hydrolase
MHHPFLAGKTNARCRIRLFCLPYAGAGSSRYFRWAKESPEEIDVCPILLPGRESRLAEPPYCKMDDLSMALSEALESALDRPFAIFGHSMGALIGFELARQLRADFGANPIHLFVSGYRAPHLPHTEPRLHGLSAGEFVIRIRGLQDAPDEVTRNEEFMELMMPTLRADLTLCETYRYRPGEPLSCPISAFGGRNDRRVKEAHLSAWAEHSSVAFSLRILEGGHLFLNECEQQLVRFIFEDLTKTVESR